MSNIVKDDQGMICVSQTENRKCLERFKDDSRKSQVLEVVI